MATLWAPDPWLMKVYGTRLAPAPTTLPAAAPLPPARDLGADAKRLRGEALRVGMQRFVSAVRAGRAHRQYQRALTFDGVIRAVISSGRPTSQHNILTASGCQLPPGPVSVWREHDPAQAIGATPVCTDGTARVCTDGECVYAEIVLADNASGHRAAVDCLTRSLWGASAGYAVLASAPRFYGLGERITEWKLLEISLTQNPRDWRCRALPVTHPAYPEFARAVGFPTEEEWKR